LRILLIVVEPVTANEVEVAPWSEVPPETVREESVVAPAVREPRVAPPVALNWPETVVEPLIASAVPVALAKLKPPNAFKSDEIVVDPVTASEVDVAP